jgi:hypothetical protein
VLEVSAAADEPLDADSITLDPEMLDPGMVDPASLSAHEAATTNADPRSRRRSVRFTILDAPGAVP